MVIKVKPWGQDQGDFVLIDEADFVEGVHEKLDEPTEKPKTQRKPKE